MISSETRFNGFDARSWHRLVTLVAPGLASFAPHEHVARADLDGGTLVVIYGAEGVRRAIHTQRGVLRAIEWTGPESLGASASKHGAHFAIAIEASVLEQLYSRMDGRLRRDDDAIATTLMVLGAVREFTDKKRLHFWPDVIPQPVPLPAHSVVQTTFDLLLPRGRSAIATLFDRGEIETSIMIRRHGNIIDRIDGPEMLRSKIKPFYGDPRRDHTIIRDHIDSGTHPLVLGVFTETHVAHRLLRDTRPGAWAQAIVERDVIFDPMPPWVALAVGAGAARSMGSRVMQFVDESPFASIVAPWISRAQKLGELATFRALGFNPLEVLARFLRRTSPQNSPPRDTPLE